MWPLTALSMKAFSATFRTLEKVESTFSLLPPYRRTKALVLDSLFGPAEDIEYVSRTAPRTPPPTR